jgi:hypothetical protein
MMGHICIDFVSFPNPEDPSSQPCFWAVDITNEMTDNAAICSFFDILMEGSLNEETGDYTIDVITDGED